MKNSPLFFLFFLKKLDIYSIEKKCGITAVTSLKRDFETLLAKKKISKEAE